MKPRVTFYYDVVCPFAYLASTAIRALCDEHGAELLYRPMLLGGVFNAIGRGEPKVPEARTRGTGQDLARHAVKRKVPLTFPDGHPRRTVEAMRLLVAAELTAPARLERLTNALYRGYWADGRDLADRAVLAQLAAAHELDVDLIDRDDVKARLRENTDEAVREGVFGAPSFVIERPVEGGEPSRRMVFGHDRLHFVAQAIDGTLGQPRPASATATATASEVPAESAREVVFYYDYSSPYTYLASTQIERVAAEAGGRVAWRPIFLGGLFKDLGNSLVPINDAPAPRRAYFLRDMYDWAAYWGAPFQFPSRFPMMTITALRMSLAAGADEPRLAHAIFRAFWVEDRDINDKATLVGIASSVGLDGKALLERTNDPAIKMRLMDNTSQAVGVGAFGLPTFTVGRELFFGQDRLDFVAEALSR